MELQTVQGLYRMTEEGGKVGKSTRVTEKAGVHIMRALERAKGSLADIPLGVHKLDPRTEKKRALETQHDPLVDTTLTRLLYELRGHNPDQEDINNSNGGQQQE